MWYEVELWRGQQDVQPWTSRANLTPGLALKIIKGVLLVTTKSFYALGMGGGESQLLQNQNKEQIISLQIKKEQSEGMLENSRSLSSECQSKTNNDFKIRYGKQSGRYGKS